LPILDDFPISSSKGNRHSRRYPLMSLNINLSPQLEELIRSKVAAGLYSSASEVVREALRMMEEHDRIEAAKLERLRQDMREGLDSGPATRWDAEEIKREGRKQRRERNETRDD
jgi:antitoxin ParD1/3/4